MIDPLVFTVAVLAFIEVCLGLVFYSVGKKLVSTGEKIMKLIDTLSLIQSDIDKAKIELSNIKASLNKVYDYAKTLGSGKLRLTGDVPMIGRVDLDLELGGKK